jgi:hypothetical protein
VIASLNQKNFQRIHALEEMSARKEHKRETVAKKKIYGSVQIYIR